MLNLSGGRSLRVKRRNDGKLLRIAGAAKMISLKRKLSVLGLQRQGIIICNSGICG